MRDELGLDVTSSSTGAVTRFSRAVESFCKFRRDASGHIAEALAADPDFAMAKVLRGYIMLGGFKRANYGPASAALPSVLEQSGSLSRREQLHVEAWRSWATFDLKRALILWDDILSEYPTDLLAVRMIDLNAFWGGERNEVRRNAERAERAWRPGMAGHDVVLSIAALADEEAGAYGPAERKARQALDLDATNFFAAHALSHVFEMQGRTAEAKAWFGSLGPVIETANNMRFHLSWHQALVLLDSDASNSELLAFYDGHVRDLQSPLTQALPDLYIDLMNATSLLWRLQHAGVDVGGRWQEQADRAESRRGDVTNLLGSVHYVLALVGAGRLQAAEAMIAEIAEGSAPATTLRDVALPMCRAVLASGRKDHRAVVAELFPVIGEVYRLGGSKAQHDLLTQLLLDAAERSGDRVVQAAVLSMENGARPAPIEGRRGYRSAHSGRVIQ